MIRSTMSIMGLYNFNPEIFEGLHVPEEMNRDNVITEILAQCAELELVYPSYNTMKLLIKTWTDAELHLWERAYIDSTIKYNPIWNVDGTETEEIARKLKGVNTTESRATGNAVNSKAGYNKPNELTASERTDTTGNNNGSGTTDEDETITTVKTRGGNIGVTKTTDMLADDWALLPKLNAYQFIVDSFKRRFCLLVY